MQPNTDAKNHLISNLNPSLTNNTHSFKSHGIFFFVIFPGSRFLIIALFHVFGFAYLSHKTSILEVGAPKVARLPHYSQEDMGSNTLTGHCKSPVGYNLSAAGHSGSLAGHRESPLNHTHQSLDQRLFIFKKIPKTGRVYLIFCAYRLALIANSFFLHEVSGIDYLYQLLFLSKCT